MGVPSIKELMNPVLEAIRQAGGSAHIDEITEAVIRHLGLSEDDANQPHAMDTKPRLSTIWAGSERSSSGLD